MGFSFFLSSSLSKEIRISFDIVLMRRLLTFMCVSVIQGGSCSRGDIYEAVLEIDKNILEPLQIFDTSGEVSVNEKLLKILHYP